MPVWLVAVLAVLGIVLGSGGVAPHVVAWLRERSKLRLDQRKAELAHDVDVKKLEAGAEAAKREDTGRFSDKLMDRVAALEAERGKYEERETRWKEERARSDKACDERVQRAVANAEGKAQKAFEEAQRVSGELEVLERDYDVLLEHTIDVEQQNRVMRSKLNIKDAPPSSERFMEVVRRRRGQSARVELRELPAKKRGG